MRLTLQGNPNPPEEKERDPKSEVEGTRKGELGKKRKKQTVPFPSNRTSFEQTWPATQILMVFMTWVRRRFSEETSEPRKLQSSCTKVFGGKGSSSSQGISLKDAREGESLRRKMMTSWNSEGEEKREK